MKTIRLLGVFQGRTNLTETTTFLSLQQKLLAQSIRLELELLPAQPPDTYRNRLALALAPPPSGGSTGEPVDVFMVDANDVGTAVGARMADLTGWFGEEEARAHLEGLFEAARVDGRLLAVPYFLDYALLLYRKDILSKHGFNTPPATWAELESTMEAVVAKENPDGLKTLHGYLGQYLGERRPGSNMFLIIVAGDSIIANVLEWFASVGGGVLIDKGKQVTLNNPQAVDILERAFGWLRRDLSPWISILMKEDDSLSMFLEGKTLFHRNRWSALRRINTNDSFRDVPHVSPNAIGAAVLPGSVKGKTASSISGLYLAVNPDTRNISAAVQVLKAINTVEFQMLRARESGAVATLKALYSADPAYCSLDSDRLCGLVKSLQLVPYPAAVVAPNYTNVAERIGIWTSRAITGEVTVKEALDNFASPIFMETMLLGTLIAYSTVFVYTGMPSTVTCILQPWLVFLSYAITISAMIVKNWRIYRLFRDKYSVDLKISDATLIKWWTVMVMVAVAILSVWTAVDPPKPILISIADTVFWSCRSSSLLLNWIFIGACLFYGTLLLGAGVFLAYSTRNVKSQYNESQHIGYIVYTMVVLFVILIPLCYIDVMGASATFLFRNAAIKISAISVLVHLLLPKLMEQMRHRNDNVMENRLHQLTKADPVPRCGKTITVKSLFLKDIKKDDQFMLMATVNGSYIEMQFESSEQKICWVKALKALVTDVKAEAGEFSSTGGAAP
ncbi:hypothetical protein HDU96_008423 [Phlyctochytrium bullatum]|nr:hypothetical protein HDU96_008423 [Phlyctochytrium bullatum]